MANGTATFTVRCKTLRDDVCYGTTIHPKGSVIEVHPAWAALWSAAGAVEVLDRDKFTPEELGDSRPTFKPIPPLVTPPTVPTVRLKVLKLLCRKPPNRVTSGFILKM